MAVAQDGGLANVGRRAVLDLGVEGLASPVADELLLEHLPVHGVVDVVGEVEVRAIFRASRVGTIAGSYVTEGRVTRGAMVRLVRDGAVVYDGTIASLRRGCVPCSSAGRGPAGLRPAWNGS